MVQLKEVSLAQHSETSTKPLVTWAGQPAATDWSSTWLHFLFVDHLAGLGCVAAGWLADPFSTVVSVSVDGTRHKKLDFLSEAILLSDRHQLQGFEVPPGATAKIGFVLLVPDRLLETSGEINLRLNLAAGHTHDRVVPPVGDISQLSNILAAAPVDYGLRVIAYLLKAWRSRGGRSPDLPERLESLARQVHRQIERRPDNGAHLSSSHIDVTVRVGNTGMLLAGRLSQEYGETIQDIALVSLFGRRVLLDTPLPRKSTPDVPDLKAGIDHGFATFAAIEQLDRLDMLWFLEVTMAGGAIGRVPFICPPELPPLQGIAAAVALVEEEDADLRDLFDRAISPAVEWFWSRTRVRGLSSTEVVYGSPPSDAGVSVIVPVYGRLDLVRHQIARFSNDPQFHTATGTVELIYVLDDPAKAEEFRRLCRYLHDVYGVPFRTLIQSENRGYSAANNAGAAIATGDLLLLLNSDVFPDKPRWIAHLAKIYNRLDSCGVLGCRLLFEDGSIQHAGMSFRDSRMVSGCWENDHPGQGLSILFDTHATAEPVPAVTGACLMIARALFNKLGALSEDYVIADFEDSDLCLRVQKQGLKVYYTPEVELYHLERQSVRLVCGGNAKWRRSLTLYNMWKHSLHWGEFISGLMENFARVSDPEVLQLRSSTDGSDLPVPATTERSDGVGQRAKPPIARRSKHRRLIGTEKRPVRDLA